MDSRPSPRPRCGAPPPRCPSSLFFWVVVFAVLVLFFGLRADRLPASQAEIAVDDAVPSAVVAAATDDRVAPEEDRSPAAALHLTRPGDVPATAESGPEGRRVALPLVVRSTATPVPTQVARAAVSPRPAPTAAPVPRAMPAKTPTAAAGPAPKAAPPSPAPPPAPPSPTVTPIAVAKAQPERPRPSTRGGQRPALTRAQADFLDDAVPAGQRSQEKFGVPTSVTVAQAILESAWGESRLAREGKNLFGIKALRGPGPAGVIRIATQEYVGGRFITVQDTFRAYNTIAESFEDHGRFLRDQPRYAAAMKVANDPRAFARAIARAGYATDPQYPEKLIGLMDRLDLYPYDRR